METKTYSKAYCILKLIIVEQEFEEALLRGVTEGQKIAIDVHYQDKMTDLVIEIVLS